MNSERFAYLAKQSPKVVQDTIRKWLNIQKIRCIRYTTTWECNSKCDSCNIWQIDPKKDEIMTLEQLQTFAHNKLLKDVRRIIISGGEPFLLEDLPERLEILHKAIPKAYFGMTANGLTPDRILRLVKRIYELSPDINLINLGLSLNGRPEIHDRSRGIKGAFDKTMKTFELIKDLVPVRFSFTFLPYNIDEYKWVQQFAKEHCTEAYICWTVISNRFFDRNFLGGMTIQEFYQHLRPLLNEVVSSIEKRYLYNSFIEERLLDCTAFRDYFHIDPYGNIFPCNFKLTDDRILGNIKEKRFDEIWDQKERLKIIKEIKCGVCMYPNGVCGDSDLNYSVSYTGMHKAFLWYLKNRGKI
jgi:radical SAM protein with 4Fe4S-binding SPASM domain